MSDFSGCAWADGIVRINAAVSEFIVFRFLDELPPMRLLMQFTADIEAADTFNAHRRIFELTGALITGGYRRISGNLWLDFLMHELLISPNAFARAAAENSACVDDALYNAMRADLSAFNRLAQLDIDVLSDILRDRIKSLKQHSRSGLDATSLMASAAWGGGAIRVPSNPASDPVVNSISSGFSVPSWSYAGQPIYGSYVADDALEEIYRRLVNSADWTELEDDILSFHASHGYGEFLKYRNMLFDGGFKPLPALRAGDFVPLLESEYRSLLNNAVAFMREESSVPMLICGDDGMGKTTMLFELTDELPRLRLIYVAGGLDNQLDKLFSTLSNQPLKFMVMIEDIDNLSLRGICEPLLPPNVLLAASAKAPCAPSLFGLTVRLPQLRLNDFTAMVERLLAAKNIELPAETVRNACVDYQVDTRCEFNISSAVSVSELLQS